MMAHLITKIFFAGFFFLSLNSAAQRFYSKSGRIEFFSDAAMEDIKAVNKSVTCVLDTKSGAIQFSVLMKGFEFPKALMQEHFNENYVESDKYPRAEFKGSITNNSSIDYTKPGSYAVTVNGKLTIHGVTKSITTTGTIKPENDGVESTSTFNITLSDYRIKIPSVVKDKVSNTIKITVVTHLEPLKN